MLDLNMKLHYKLLLFLVPTALDAQLDSIPQSFIMPSTELGYSIHMGSTGMNNDMLYKLGLGGHISSEAIDRNEEGMGKVSKVGSISNLDLTHYFKAPLFGQREKFRWRSVGVNYATAQSAIFAKDAWRLLFKGNSDYLGQTLEINKLNYTRWNSTSLNASFSLSEKTSRIGERLTLDYLSFGLDLVHQFNNARFGNSDLYTDSNANFINTRLQGAYVLGNSNRALDGIGTHIGAGFKIGRLKLSIDKLGFAYMGNLNSYKVNTEQTFGGNFKSVDDIPVKTISQADIQRSQLNSGAWVNKQRDTIINTFVPTKENASAIRLLPFIIQAEFASEDKRRHF